MNKPVSHLSLVWAIARKDLLEYSRDKLWLFLTGLTLILMVVIFWVLPNRVQESITVGVSGINVAGILRGLESTAQEGLDLVFFDDAADLKSAVAGEATVWRSAGKTTVIAQGSATAPPEAAQRVTVNIGLAFPTDFFAATAA